MSFLFLKIAFHSTKKAYTENSSILQLTCGTSDVIMMSGYYDYDLIAKELLRSDIGRNVLELGCGTGLILEKLLENDGLSIHGVDITEEMLDIARFRLKRFDNISLSRENVTSLSLDKKVPGQKIRYGFFLLGVWTNGQLVVI
uniref:Methyltransferase domain-containing protein n=3 Tax=Candidatus Kentrum sp. FM TaxID=2126340 RepID=A0A450X3U6_9GAMM|nr:MAG: Methyltransferase domain-containing protein [Candidatus Kentron sp. FM]VFJ75420.1 MAG: Methyltransferase domain-containing protein [Candidatus Kentron sp. FM]VFK23982.1 MAG: Methyltransferase domain-containing protein [Candidatus Kentron sp. FM]